jgi:hypothetical protein
MTEAITITQDQLTEVIRRISWLPDRLPAVLFTQLAELSRDPDAVAKLLRGISEDDLGAMTPAQLASIGDAAEAVGRAAHLKLWELPAEVRHAAYYASRTGQPYPG